MLRFIGAVLLVAAGSLTGRAKAAVCWEKAGAIQSMMEILELVRAGLQSRQRLMEICLSHADEEGCCGRFFAAMAAGLEMPAEIGVGQLWEQSAALAFGDALSSWELAAFSSVGAALASGQAIDDGAKRSLRRLEKMLSAAEERASRDGRLYTGVGMAVGAMLAIMLV